MEKKDIRVLALDLDGTLTNDQKVVTPATRAALDLSLIHISEPTRRS